MLKNPRTLRQYQQNAIEFINRFPYDNICIQQPCRTGKTAVMAQIVADNPLKSILILAPNNTLVHNIHDYFLPSHDVQKYIANGSLPYASRVLITTYETGKKYISNHWDLIIFDECHRSAADGMSEALKPFGGRVIGFTATPNRLDGKPLRAIFKRLFLSPPLRWFIDKGYVADFELVSKKSPVFSTDLSTDDLSAQSKIFGNELHIQTIVDLYLERFLGKKTIIFATSVEHGNKIKEAFDKVALSAEFVSHKTKKDVLDDHFNDFKFGDLKILINIQLFTEGIDVPDCRVVILDRFTFSPALYMQMAMRPFTSNGEKRAIIADLVGNVYYHGTPDLDFHWSLDGLPRESATRTNDQTSNYGCVGCGEPLFKPRHVAKIPGVYRLCCLACKAHQEFLVQGASGGEGKTIETVLSSDMLHLIDNKAITGLTRALFNKSWKQETRIMFIASAEIPNGIKVKCLKFLGLDDKKINDLV